jgi:ceramide glucosyltransferase
VINHVLEQHPGVNARLMVGEEDVGPNPKIRNLSKAYCEAAGDIVWVLDCNIWVSPGTLRRSVELLEGSKTHPGYKLVHHLPIAVDITNTKSYTRGSQSPTGRPLSPLLTKESESAGKSWLSRIMSFGGGRMEENFLSSSHAKFYTAINTLRVAPCVVGKSEMFRRSHLAEVTRDGGAKAGLVYFSDYICEDHKISEKLFLSPLDEELSGEKKWGKHGFGDDLVFQPIESMSVLDYLARRTRWIRVRKYETLSATFAECLTESVMCSLVGSYAVATVPFVESRVGSSWSVFWGFWFLSMCIWAFFDRMLFNFLHSYKCTPVDDNSPHFIVDKPGRRLGDWILQWIGREMFAFPIWCCALWPGPINWRGRLYRIRWSDRRVEEIGTDGHKRRD